MFSWPLIKYGFYIVLLIILTCVRCSKWHTGTFDFENPASWFSGHPPCALDLVVFPELYSAVLPLPTAVDVSGLVLFTDGALLLNQEATLTLGSTSKKYPCVHKHLSAYIKPSKISKWFDPQSWRNSETSIPNMAIPDLDRVPCNNEPVVISRAKGPLAFDLENVPFLRLGQLSLMGSSVSKDYLQKLFSTDIGQLLFRNSAGVRVEYYRNEICGCHKDFNSFVEPICHNVMDSCSQPLCLNPITPYGSCCPVCGAVLRFTLDQCNPEVRKSFDHVLKNELAVQGFSNETDLAVYVDYFSSTGYTNYLQAVIVDRGKYSGKSIEFTKQFLASSNKTDLLKAEHKLEVLYAGGPYIPKVSLGSMLLILICAVFVCIVCLIIFAHYAPQNRFLNRIPPLIHDPRWLRSLLLRSPFVFARFDTAGDSSGVEATHERILGYDAKSSEVRECAFDNPMFSKSTKLMSYSGASSHESEAALPHSKPLEEQELTIIKLASSDENSELDSES